MHAYLLVRTRPSAASTVAEATRELDGVTDVEVLGAGPYDVLVDLTPGTFADLGSTVTEIRELPGVESAVACTTPGTGHSG